MCKVKDLVGKRFGKLEVVSRAEDYVEISGRHRPQWLCKCDCGGTIITKSTKLQKGTVTCCDQCSPRKRRSGLKLDLTGKKFGKWTVLKEAPRKTKSSHTRWICRCECGTVREVDGGHLTQHTSISCGCSRKEVGAIDLTGRKFGRWTVVERVGKDKHNNIRWLCRCDCGTEKVLGAHMLLSKNSQSCGCLKREKMHARRENLVGKKFNMLTVIEKAEDHIYPSGKHRPRYKCLCDCGRETIVMANALKNGSCKSCGHLQKEKASEANSVDLVGKKFGRLTVISRSAERNKRGSVMWECACDCGKYVRKTTVALTHNRSRLKSCGCAAKDRIREVSFKDLTGEQFGRLTVLRVAEPHEIKDKARGTHWFCQCSCGNTTIVTVQNLHGSHTQSCGCLHREKLMEYNDLTGQRFGKLTVIRTVGRNKSGNRLWECQCECGHTTLATAPLLHSGHKISCGCVNSKGELKIANILKESGIKFRKQMYYDDLLSESGRHFRFDFFLPENNYLIEYDGEQHFLCSERGWHTKEDLRTVQKRDKIKNEYCANKDIPLIRIPYTQYNNLCLEDLLLETTKFRVV